MTFDPIDASARATLVRSSGTAYLSNHSERDLFSKVGSDCVGDRTSPRNAADRTVAATINHRLSITFFIMQQSQLTSRTEICHSCFQEPSDALLDAIEKGSVLIDAQQRIPIGSRAPASPCRAGPRASGCPPPTSEC